MRKITLVCILAVGLLLTLSMAGAEDGFYVIPVKRKCTGKTFSNSASTGLIGTIETQTLSDSGAIVSAGYYNATTLDGVDADLSGENIRSGVEIFGMTGTYIRPEIVPKTGQTTSYGQ